MKRERKETWKITVVCRYMWAPSGSTNSDNTFLFSMLLLFVHTIVLDGSWETETKNVGRAKSMHALIMHTCGSKDAFLRVEIMDVSSPISRMIHPGSDDAYYLRE